jgi:Phosphodiester glycosidase
MWRSGRTVISAPNGSKLPDAITSLQEGQGVRLTWSAGWPGALDAIAGNPVLVSDGKNIAYRCATAFCNRHPRTGIGVTPTGRILMVTVDGRQTRSRGMNLVQMARLFVHLGATEALNLDGGGSTTMVVRGSVINKPSDPGGERAVSSSILVIRGDDPGEPAVLPHIPTVPTSPQRLVSSDQGAAVESFGGGPDRSVLDPASTGGMLQATRDRQHKRRVLRLPGPLRNILQRYELHRAGD